MPTYPDQVRAAERAAIRKRRHRHGFPAGMASLRVAEINKILTDNYGTIELPDDDAGRADVRIMVHHLARRSGYPLERIATWLNARAPWFTGEERALLVDAAITNPLRWKADTLGQLLQLTAEQRDRLRIRTIGSVGTTAAERTEARRLKNLAHQRELRRAGGKLLREEYTRNSINSGKPWKALGMGRTRWYLLRRQERDRTSSKAI